MAGLPVQAQQQNQVPAGGVLSTFSTQIGVEAGRNLDLDPGSKDKIARLYGLLGYSYRMTTRQTMLSFSAQIRPETDDNDQGLFPQGALQWTHEGARTRFSFGANYAEARITDQSIAFDDETGQILNYDISGTRAQTRLNASVEGGIDMPLGYTLQVDRSEITYSDTPAGSTGYSDSTTTGAAAKLRADISAMTQLSLDLSHRLYEVEGGASLRQRTTDQASLGVQQRIDALWSVSASVGRSWIDTERIDRPDESIAGMTYVLGAKRADALGAYSFDFAQSQTESGSRRTVSLGRERETDLGRISGAIGISRGESGGSDMIGQLAFSTELPRDTLRANVARSVQTDDDGDDVVVTRISANVGHKLSEVNGLNFGLTASATEYPTYDKNRLDATVSYEHLLSRDVNLEAGVKMSLSQSGVQEDANSQSLFLTLSRNFNFLR
ncbi:hypothetical protein [Paenirhodobacter populi]|uniref:TIGR03016 family PEP-CTERM system-associated outer membrane protein n=1 Tax=Paenirhodobacter populi TaxID=2306993 RepID=A0A443IQ68_9RHOB|nr:hypothetical protein [Sinirhodobacter populi]RWR08141.1 hypothetical protein D2T33_16070 [Sinirhodobacter populi]